jgi:hypothetical protein
MRTLDAMGTLYERLMQRATPPENPRQPRAPNPVPTANYPALVEVLTGLHQVPDGLGETVLSSGEAAAIRARGFGARAGWFHCEVAKSRFGRVRSCADHRHRSVQRSTISGRSDRDCSPLVFALSVGL